MRRHAARILGLIMGLFSLLIFSACAGTQAQNTPDSAQAENTQDTQDTQDTNADQSTESEQGKSAAQQIQSAAKATVRETAEAAEVVGRTLTGTKTPEDQEQAKKQRARNAEQLGIGGDSNDAQAEQAEQSEQDEPLGIGGGPVESQTLATLDTIDADTKDYKKRIDKAGDKISPAAKLRLEQVQEDSKDLRKQYNSMKKKSDFDISALDEEYKSSADQLKDSWEHVSKNLSRELDEASAGDDKADMQ